MKEQLKEEAPFRFLKSDLGSISISSFFLVEAQKLREMHEKKKLKEGKDLRTGRKRLKALTNQAAKVVTVKMQMMMMMKRESLRWVVFW